MNLDPEPQANAEADLTGETPKEGREQNRPKAPYQTRYPEYLSGDSMTQATLNSSIQLKQDSLVVILPP